MKILKGLLMIITAPVILVLTLFVWLCTGLIYISGLVLGLFSTVIALLGVAVNVGCWSHRRGHIIFDKDLNFTVDTHTGFEYKEEN